MDRSESEIGEFALIDWIRHRKGSHPGQWTKLGIGDDCAILRPNPGSDLLVTTDMLMDGRHFRLAEDGPRAVGYKALAVNLSDIAAMAGVPRAAVVSVALPRAEAAALAQGIYLGMRELAERFGVDLVGGDTNAWDGPLVISVTLLGEATVRGAVRRSGARPGDAILVTGPLGGSLFGVTSAGFTMMSYLHATQESLLLRDILTGLVKAFMFGVVITAVGCQEGFATGLGSEQVGRSTTAAVVKSIFMVVLVDLVFTSIFYLTAAH